MLFRSVQLSGKTGPNQSTALDDPSIPNLVFQYKGSTVLDNAALAGLKFSAQSIYGKKTDGWSTSQTSTIDLKRKNGSTDATDVPTSAVPLPAASWMGLGLLAALGGAQLLRRRNAMA